MAKKIRQLNKSIHRGLCSVRRRKRVTVSVIADRCAILESLEARTLLAADPTISEFQALNTSTLQDEDGDYEDWIEIRNPDTVAVNIGGWYLTDDKGDLTKWQIPANTTIASGDEILVFASGKDRNNGPNGELHTNFRLSGDGDYLALVRPNGTTVVQAYDPYPAQFENQSYGLAVGRNAYELVTDDAPIKAFVPTSDALGKTWTDTTFNDGAWLAGAGAVGYEQLAAGFSLDESFSAPLSNHWTVNIPAGGTGTATVTSGVLRLAVPAGQEMSGTDRGTAPIVYRAIPNSPADFELVTKLSQGINDKGAAGIVVMDATTGIPAVQLEYNSRLNFRLLAGGTSQASKVSLSRNEYSLRLVRDGLAKTWTGYYRLADADPWTEIGVATDGIDDTPVVVDPRVGMYARTPGTNTMTANFQDFNISVPDQRPVYGPEIGLDVKAAFYDKNASIYLRIPFVFNEDPTRLDELSLSTRYDDGFIAYLNGAELTRQNVPIQDAWDSAAGTPFGAVNGQIPVRQFGVSASLGSLKQGQNVLAIHAMNVAKDDLDFFFDAQMFGAEILTETKQFFTTPTPGASNELPAAPMPQIIGQQGVFYGNTTVELVLAQPLPGLEIRYTLDGSDPTPSSALYSGALTLNSSAMLQARTFDTTPNPGFAPSNPASGTFMAVDPALQSVSSNLPLVLLTSLGQGLSGAGTNDLTAMNAVIYDTSKVNGLSSFNSNLLDYLGRAGTRDRGSSTAGQAKPNMVFETWGSTGTTKDDDQPAGLLGMNSDADWVMHAPFSFDALGYRNQIAFDLSNGMGGWASNYRNVEVYMDLRGDGVITEEDYFGLYVLIEKIEEGPDKVDIVEIEPTDNTADPNDPLAGPISGGYIWKIDRADPDAPPFTAGGQGINWVFPKDPDSRTARPDQKATREQEQWVVNYFNEFAATLANPDINDPNGYSKYINPVTWVDQHLLNVFTFNMDALRLSAYFYKDRDGRVDYGPPWDFDRSMESNDDRDDDPFHWRAQTGDLGTDFFGNGTQRWWGDLFQDPGFWQLYVDRWQMWRDTTLSEENVHRMVDEYGNTLRDVQARNTERWSASRPRSNSNYRRNELDGTYQGEINNLKKWFTDRGDFMDNNFAQRAQMKINGQVISTTTPGVLVTAGQQVELLPPALEFFIDETLIDGTPGATTGKYRVISDDSLGETWTTTGFNDAAWTSGPLGYGFDSGTDFTDLIKTQVNPNAVAPGSTTALIRIPFQVTDLNKAKANDLVLKMKYDDGFVAYLNGQRILDENLRDTTLAWDSRASTRLDREAVVFEEHDISAFKNLLVQGTNVLAIRAINASASSNDLLMLPELVSREVKFGVNPDNKVYYTTDGTDPRGPDGQPSVSATLLQGGGTLTVNESTRIIARNFDDSFRGPESNIVLTDWSGPIQYDLVTVTPSLVISEINYHPADPTAAELATQAPNDPDFVADDFEFIEIHNPGPVAANLVGVKLSDGVDFDFYQGSVESIAPGGRALVVANPAAFAARYGNNLPVIGQFTGNLNNTGEDVDLMMGTGSVIFTVSYGDSDPWPEAADGLGATLELKNSNVAKDAQSKWYSWRSSTVNRGTPGAANSTPLGVVINEVLSHTDPPVPLDDSIELHNTTGAPINIGGWFLSDSTDNLFAYEIPAGTTIAAGGYRVFTEADFNAANDPEGFGLSGTSGDNVYLVRGSKAGGVTHFVDDVHFRETLNGESLGRVPNGSGRLTPLKRNSLNATNIDPRVGPLVISEIQYNPALSAVVSAAYPTVEASDLEFVEIYNPTATNVPLTNWRLRGGSDYDFPAGTSVPAGKALVVVRFDPNDPENLNELLAFRLAYGIDATVPLVGGYAGLLNNSDDTVLLLRPDAPIDETIPRVQEDEVLYDDLLPWPVNADGTGLSLQRKSATVFGNEGTNWYGSQATPGSIPTSLPGDMDANGLVDAEDINAMFVQMRAANPNLAFDFTGDGNVDEQDRDYLVERLIGTPYGDSNFDYVFNSADLVTVLAAGEYEDATPGNSEWQTGDWDGDGDFTTGDFVLALSKGGYESAATPAASVARRELFAAALQSREAASVETDAESDPALVSSVARRRPLLDNATRSVESLFAEAPADDASDKATDELVDALLDDGLNLI
jgi:hypothetical protein